MPSESHREPLSWPVEEPLASWPVYQREKQDAQERAYSLPVSFDSDLLDRSFALQSCYEKAAVNASFRQNEDLFITLSGVPPRQRHDSYTTPMHIGRLFHGATMSEIITRCYVVCFTILLATWMCVHPFMIWGWFAYGGQEVGLAGVLYWLSFSLPSWDAFLNLGFAAYQLHKPCGNDAESYGVGNGRAISWNLQKKRPLWFRVLSLVVLTLLCTRAALLLFFCNPYVCTVPSWLQASTSVLESLPLLASGLAMYGHTNIMIATLDELRRYIIDRKLTLDRCLAVYRQFQEFVIIRGKRWEILIATSTGIETYIVFFQTLWCMRDLMGKTRGYVKDATLVSLYVLVLGVFIVSKLVPLALFNYRVKRFTHDLIVAAQASEDAAPHEDPQQLASFRKVVSTMALLFSTQPPCLKVLRFAIDYHTLAKLAVSVLLTSMSRFLVDLVDSC